MSAQDIPLWWVGLSLAVLLTSIVIGSILLSALNWTANDWALPIFVGSVSGGLENNPGRRRASGGPVKTDPGGAGHSPPPPPKTFGGGRGRPPPPPLRPLLFPPFPSLLPPLGGAEHPAERVPAS